MTQHSVANGGFLGAVVLGQASKQATIFFAEVTAPPMSVFEGCTATLVEWVESCF